MRRLVGLGSSRGRSLPSRAGDVCRQPLVWAGFAVVLSLSGPRGRRAVLRGMSCSAAAALAQLPIKGLVQRPRPRGAGLLGTSRSTSSFPSGHTASDLSFMLGVSQEIPALLLPLSAATLGSHWSLVRSHIHYPSDVIAGGTIAVAVNAVAWTQLPPRRLRAGRANEEQTERSPAGRVRRILDRCSPRFTSSAIRVPRRRRA